MVEHFLICPDTDRTQLLVESTEDLSTWLNQEHLTNLELAFWIPKYILKRSDKPFASLGVMSPRMKALAISQDKRCMVQAWVGQKRLKRYFLRRFSNRS